MNVLSHMVVVIPAKIQLEASHVAAERDIYFSMMEKHALVKVSLYNLDIITSFSSATK